VQLPDILPAFWSQFNALMNWAPVAAFMGFTLALSAIGIVLAMFNRVFMRG